MVHSFRLRIQQEDVSINVPDRIALVDAVRNRMRDKKGFAIATLNLDHVVKLQRSADFARAYRQHDFVVADGNPIVWLSRLAGHPVSLVPGSDLVEPLAAVAAQEGVPIALLGATDETLAGAASVLSAALPDLRVAARLAPGRNFDPHGDEADALIEILRSSGARLAFLALGAPRQEIFAARCRSALPDVGFISIGAGLDFLAGSQRRAPRWVRGLALEWVWRMLLNSRRLAGRYAMCLTVLPSLALDAVTGIAAPIDQATLFDRSDAAERR